MKDGVRIVNCARGELLDLDALEDALDSGKVGGREPRRLPGRADDRASDLRLRERGRDAAPGRLDGGGAGPRRRDHRRAGGGRAERASWSRTRSTSRRSAARTWRCSSPTCRCRAQLGRLAMSLAERALGRPASRSPTTATWPSFDTRLLTLSVLNGALLGPGRRERELRQRARDRRGARHPASAS